VAVLPGKDTLQPLATTTGLVRSAASARAEVSSPVGAEAGGRRRGGRGGRGGRGAGEQPELAVAAIGAEPDDLAAADGAAASGAEAVSRRQEPDLVAVPMEPDQELVYGWLGLNPALLLDPQPTGENLMVRVVRPGDDPEAVLEAARQQLAASGSRRRRRGGRGGGDREPSGNGQAVQPSEASWAGGESEPAPALVEITPLAFEPQEPAPEPITTVIEAPLVQVPLTRRTASSRRSATVATPSPEQQEAVGIAAEPEEEADAGEPRRRRRRSSAAV
jgi:ribonuclease E